MLKHRLFFGALLIAALLGIIYLDDWLAQRVPGDLTPHFLININLDLHDGFLPTAIIAVLILLANHELYRLLQAAGHQPLRYWPAIINLGLIGIPFLVRHGLNADVTADIGTDYTYTATWLTVGLIGCGVFVMARRKTHGATAALAASLLIILYLGLLASFLVRLRVRAPGGAAWLLLYYLGVVKCCDIGAFFTGRSLGKHNLIEWLSPKKTIEGLGGGIAASILVAAIVPPLVRTFGPPRLEFLFDQRFLQTLLFGLLMALAGQFGDLLESLIKRDAQAKDSANAIPAFGGVLDILDSILVTAPLAYLLLVE